MKKKENTIEIDGERLRNVLNEKAGSTYLASKKIGFGDSTLSACCSKGRISKAALNLLDYFYGIKYEDVAPVKEKSESEMTDEMVRKVCAGVSRLLKPEVEMMISDAMAIVETIVKNTVKETIKEEFGK